MMALTLHPEWAFAVAYLGKDVENRFWHPSPLQLPAGDWLAIHAGAHVGGKKGITAEKAGYSRLFETAERAGWRLDPSAALVSEREVVPLSLLTCSAVVALVRFQGACIRRGVWSVDGQSQWRWDRMVRLPRPVPCRGAQALWALPSEVEAEVRLRVGELP
jgi:hypothetical protein